MSLPCTDCCGGVPSKSNESFEGKLLLNQQQQQLQMQMQQQMQQQMRPLNAGNLALAQSSALMQGQAQAQAQLQQQQQQFNQRFGQPGQNFDPSTQMYQTQAQIGQAQLQQHQQQQQQLAFQGTQLGNTGSNQMFQQGQGPFQQQQQQAQPPGQQMQLNQSMGRGMRQQNPMMNTTQTQGQFSTMFQGSGTGIGNKQRPTSLDLNTGTPRFGQQLSNQPFAGQMQGQQGNTLQAPGQQPGQPSTGMLGSLFASGKKILEEATTPLGARGPFAHPNQPHQPMMGHMPHQQGLQSQAQGPMQQLQSQQQGPLGPQATMNQFGQPQGPYNPMVAGQVNPQGGSILNSMKSIFKL